MANLEHGTGKWRATAVAISREGEGLVMVRPAVFVFDLEGGGFAWVEPQYADPHGAASNALHERETPLEWDRGVADGTMPDGERITMIEFDPDDLEELLPPIAWFETYLMDAGRTKDEERALVRQRLLDSGIKLAPA